jgi:hypothetical protein
MDFVNRLQPRHLHSFWYFASKINFSLIATFGALLQATSPSEEEGRFYEMRMSEYRWTLGVSRRRAEWLGGAVGMVEASRRLLGNLEKKPSLADQFSSAGVPPTSSSASRSEGRTGDMGPPPLRQQGQTTESGRSSPEDVDMAEAGQGGQAHLRRFPSGASFHGFGAENYEQFGGEIEDDARRA